MTDEMADAVDEDMNTFQMKRVSTRIALLDLGLARLPVGGYVGTTVADLVAGTAFTRAAFYSHFDGKETYFLELLRYRAAQRHGWWRVADEPGVEDLREAISRAMRRMAELAPEVEPWALLIAEFHQSVKGDVSRAHKLRDMYGGWREELTAFFEPPVARGWVRPGCTATEAGDVVFAYVQGMQAHAQLFGLRLPDLVADCVRLVGSDGQVHRAQAR